MLKAGIFMDIENLSRNGGWGMRYNVLTDLVMAQNATVLRANAYLARDLEREASDYDFRRRNEEYRNAIRRNGFHLVLKIVKRYRDESGDIILKANADLDLAVDAMVQSDNLDYILLGSGDGDFLRLVRALQNRGKRVDLVSFANTSHDLKREVDYFFSGFLVPGLIPVPYGERDRERTRGVMYALYEERGFGFISLRTGLGIHDIQTDVFCHINEFEPSIDNDTFANLKASETILEFDLIRQEDGKFKAANISILNWQNKNFRGE